MFLRNIKEKPKKTRKFVSLQIDPQQCVGCGACIRACQYGAVKKIIE